MLVFAEWILKQTARQSSDQAIKGTSPTVRPSTFADFTRRQNLVPGSTRALGWDTPSPGGSAGTLLSPRSIGHTGFTGTSLWIDLDHQLAIVLLSNRVNPTRDNPRWAPIRAQIADLVMTTILEVTP